MITVFLNFSWFFLFSQTRGGGSREEEPEFIRETNSSQPLASLCGFGLSLILSSEVMGPKKSLMGSGKTWVPVPDLPSHRHTDSQKSLILSAPQYPPLQTSNHDPSVFCKIVLELQTACYLFLNEE